MLGGHTGDNIGDGTPKLPWQAYCDALDAIARCTSVGRHRGTRPRCDNINIVDSISVGMRVFLLCACAYASPACAGTRPEEI